MKQLNPQNASLLATFSVAFKLPPKIKRSVVRLQRKDYMLSSTAFIDGLFISDNMAGEPWAQKWGREVVKIDKNNTCFYIISYSFVRKTGKVNVPFFCN